MTSPAIFNPPSRRCGWLGAALILAVPTGALADLPIIQPPAAAAPPGGVGIGMCVRWGADPHHVADAVVVQPSGDADLDASMPDDVKALTWDPPAGYDGRWIGIAMVLGAAPPPSKLPTCAGLPPASAQAAPMPPTAPGSKVS